MKLFHAFLLFINSLNAQSNVPLTLRGQFNGKVDYTVVGNAHNALANWQTPSTPCEMLTLSIANLNLLLNQNIVAAYLSWSGSEH